MNDTDAPLDILINEFDDVRSSLLRFCLSDQAKINISSTLKGTTSPIHYALEMIRQDFAALQNVSFLKIEFPKSVPIILQHAKMFDELVMTASVYRSLTIRTNHLSDSSDIIVQGDMFLLAMEVPQSEAARYSGLPYFSGMAKALLTEKKDALYSGKVGFVERFIGLIGNIDDENWLLHDPLWLKACLHKQEKLRALRMFFYAAIVSYVLTNQTITDMFGITRQSLYCLMEEFIDLREDTNPTAEAIENFLYALTLVFFDTQCNPFLACLMGAPFDMFRQVHHNSFGDQFSNRSDLGLA